MGNPFSWAANKLGFKCCRSKQHPPGGDSLNPLIRMPGYQPLPYPHPDPEVFSDCGSSYGYLFHHSPHHREVAPAKGILRHPDNHRDNQVMTRVPNPGIQGDENHRRWASTLTICALFRSTRCRCKYASDTDSKQAPISLASK